MIFLCRSGSMTKGDGDDDGGAVAKLGFETNRTTMGHNVEFLDLTVIPSQGRDTGREGSAGGGHTVAITTHNLALYRLSRV